MTLAYHLVPKDAFQAISEYGHIVPAIERLSHEVLQNRCSSEMENLANGLKGQPVDPVAWRAVGRLEAERLQEFAERSPGSHTVTQLGCVDLLALDAENVFLQVGEWPSWASERPTGFIFEAEELLRRGASLREKDLAVSYWAGIQKFVLKKFDNLDDAKEALVSMFREIQAKYDRTGAEAAKALKKRRRGSEPAELLWHGRLPISLAVDWVYEGESQR